MTSRYRFPIVILLAILGMAFHSWSKTAEDFFHSSANLYVRGQLQEAGNEVESGLRLHPGDPKLSGLQALLKQLKDQQRQDQNQQGGDQKQDPSDSKDSKDPKQNPSQKDSPKGNGSDSAKQEPKPSDADKSKQEKNQEKQDSTQAQKQGQSDSTKTPRDTSENAQGKPPKAGQMSKEDAERLLNSFDNDEKQSQRDRQAPRHHVDVEEDW